MTRKPNTNKDGGDWSLKEKRRVWEKGNVIRGYSPDAWRSDIYGMGMKWSEFGNRFSNYGWEVDHINPVSNDGDDKITNLQPLQWENNDNKSDELNWVFSIENE